MRVKHTYRLPDGATTNNQKVYLTTWCKLRKAFEKKMNVRVTACDPGISFVDKERPNSEWVNVPNWLVERILAG